MVEIARISARIFPSNPELASGAEGRMNISALALEMGVSGRVGISVMSKSSFGGSPFDDCVGSGSEEDEIEGGTPRLKGR